MKKILVFFLAFTMLLSFVACSGTENNQNDTTAPDTTTAPSNTEPVKEYEQDTIPDNLNFDGMSINILAIDRSSYENELSVEELSSDVVNDSIYNREKFVEERLGVELNFVYPKDYDSEVSKQMSSGEDQYQIFAQGVAQLSNLIFDKFLLDLYEVEHLDLEKPWWESRFNSEAEIKSSLYITTGSLSLSLIRDTYCVFFNKALVEDYKESIPEISDIYGIITSGNWTVDKMGELSESICKDLNGNSIRDIEDVYGLGFALGGRIDAFWGSFDINVFSKTAEGWFEFDVNEERLYSGLDKLVNLLHNNSGVYTGELDDDSSMFYSAFASGTLLFLVDEIRSIERPVLRNMQDEYGILPFPKYDTAQKNYYATATDGYTAFAIPNTNTEKLEATGAALEALASYSYRETVPAYLDTALKGKYMSDAQSRNMIDLIVEGFNFDASWIYMATIGDHYTYNFRYLVAENDASFSSEHTKKQNSIKKVLRAYEISMK